MAEVKRYCEDKQLNKKINVLIDIINSPIFFGDETRISNGDIIFSQDKNNEFYEINPEAETCNFTQADSIKFNAIIDCFLSSIRNNDLAAVQLMLNVYPQIAKVKYKFNSYYQLSDLRMTRPLILAIHYENAAIIELLLANGANIEQLDFYGRTALLVAIDYPINKDFNKNLIILLLHKNADINNKGSFGKSFLDYVKENPRLRNIYKTFLAQRYSAISQNLDMMPEDLRKIVFSYDQQVI